MTKRSRRRKARDRTKPTPAQETPVYNEEPPQAESPVYDDSGAPPFPNPAAAVAPPQPVPQPVPLFFGNNAPPIAEPHPAFDHTAKLKEEHRSLSHGIGHIGREFRALQQAPMDVLLTAAAHVLDAAAYVAQEYAKRGQPISLRQAVLFTMRTVEAAEGKGLFGLINALDAHGPSSPVGGTLNARV